jgi:hypothetical protein
VNIPLLSVVPEAIYVPDPVSLIFTLVFGVAYQKKDIRVPTSFPFAGVTRYHTESE